MSEQIKELIAATTDFANTTLDAWNPAEVEAWRAKRDRVLSALVAAKAMSESESGQTVGMCKTCGFDACPVRNHFLSVKCADWKPRQSQPETCRECRWWWKHDGSKYTGYCKAGPPSIPGRTREGDEFGVVYDRYPTISGTTPACGGFKPKAKTMSESESMESRECKYADTCDGLKGSAQACIGCLVWQPQQSQPETCLECRWYMPLNEANGQCRKSALSDQSGFPSIIPGPACVGFEGKETSQQSGMRLCPHCMKPIYPYGPVEEEMLDNVKKAREAAENLPRPRSPIKPRQLTLTCHRCDGEMHVCTTEGDLFRPEMSAVVEP